MPNVNFKGVDKADNNRPISGADVIVDGKHVGRTPTRVAVAVGTHTVEFKPPEHYAIQDPILTLAIPEGWTEGDCVGDFHRKLTVSPIGSVKAGAPMSVTGHASPNARVSVHDDWGGSELSALAGPQGDWGKTWIAPPNPGQYTVTAECLGESVSVKITARK